MINIRDKKYLKSFGKNLKRLRKEKGLSQEQLAYKADLSLSQIGRIERGEINPTICTIKVIAESLEIDVKELFEFHF